MAADQGMLEQGPVDGSVLYLQHEHRSEAIQSHDQGRKVLTCRQRWLRFIRDWPLHHHVRPYVVQAGFYGLYRVGFIQLDWALITALVERWRQETHTFHLAVGESTITLQDVAVLLGLRVHGDAVTGRCDVLWEDLCEELLGLRPGVESLEGSSLKMSWLRENFLQPPKGADDETVRRHARAYILALVGGALFADKCGSSVQLAFLPLLRDFTVTERLSWGSAALAHLYRELCRASQNGAMEIAGPLTLLQLWAWERLHVGRPGAQFPAQRHGVLEYSVNQREAPYDSRNAPEVVGTEEQALPFDPRGCRWKGRFSHTDNPQGGLTLYRDQLDQQKDDQVIWQPYTPEILEKLAPICVADQQIWRTVAPLICFEIVEWHRPDRVLRQFGLRQGIPDPCDTEKELHKIDRRGRHRCNWRRYHAHYLRLWEQREQTIVTAVPNERPMDYHDPYMEWYRSITRRFIGTLTQRPHMQYHPTAATSYLLVRTVTDICRRCRAALNNFSSSEAEQSLVDVRNMCIDLLRTIGEEHQLQLMDDVESRPLAIHTQRRRRDSDREYYQPMLQPPQILRSPQLVTDEADQEPLQLVQQSARTATTNGRQSQGNGRGRARVCRGRNP